MWFISNSYSGAREMTADAAAKQLIALVEVAGDTDTVLSVLSAAIAFLPIGGEVKNPVSGQSFRRVSEPAHQYIRRGELGPPHSLEHTVTCLLYDDVPSEMRTTLRSMLRSVPVGGSFQAGDGATWERVQ